MREHIAVIHVGTAEVTGYPNHRRYGHSETEKLQQQCNLAAVEEIGGKHHDGNYY